MVAKSVADRFWEKVDKSAGPDGCWGWLASKDRKGYGKHCLPKTKRPFLAHRIAYEMVIGPIPTGLWVLHRCDNPSCVNPSHLWIGNHSDNMRDCYEKGRHVAQHSELMRRGSAHGMSKLNEEQVVQIRHKWSAGSSVKELCHEFSVSRGCIGGIVYRRKWKHLP